MTKRETILNFILFPCCFVFTAVTLTLCLLRRGAAVWTALLAAASLLAVMILIFPTAVRNIRYPAHKNDVLSGENMNWKDFFILSKSVEYLLDGNIRNLEDTKNSLARIGKAFKYDYFLVATIDVIDISNYPEDVLQEILKDEQRQLSLEMRKIFLSGMHNPYQKHFISVPNGFGVCLINVDNPHENCMLLESIQQDLNGMIDSAAEEYGYKVRITMSHIFHGMENIDLAYDEAVRLMQSPIGEARLLMPDESDLGLSLDYRRRRQSNERHLVNSVFSGNFDAARKKIENLVDDNQDSIQGLSAAKATALDRINWILETAELEESVLYDDQLLFHLKQIGKAQSLQEVKLHVRAVFDVMSEASTRKAAASSGVKIENVIRYISENFRNPDLNVSAVCEAFQISTPYLSHLFKQSTGTGMLDFIHQTRMNEAKRLLRETSKSINEISAGVGYSSCWTMIRTFKRFEDVTPSEYRAAYGAAQEKEE